MSLEMRRLQTRCENNSKIYIVFKILIAFYGKHYILHTNSDKSKTAS